MVAPTFKKATDTDPGSASIYGAPDIKYAAEVLDGSHATDRIQASLVEGAIAYPDLRRFGGYFGGIFGSGTTPEPSSLEGFVKNAALEAWIGTPTIVYEFHSTAGKRTRFQTTGAIGNKAGHSLGGDTIAGVTRDMGFRFKVKFWQANASNQRNFIGMKSFTGSPTGITPLNSASGYMTLYASDVHSRNLYWHRNDGSATYTGTVDQWGDWDVLDPTNPHTIEIIGDSTNMRWSIDGGTFTTHTTGIPATSTVLYPVIWQEALSTQTRNFHLYWWYLELLS